MQTGWLSLDGTWYWFSNSGAMVTGWQYIGNAWYYFGGSGAMKMGWQSIGSAWYYLNGSGAMATGWQSIGGSWYYFDGSGAMVHDQWMGNYYLTGSGAMATNTWVGGYYVNGSGAWVPGYGQSGSGSSSTQGVYYHVGKSAVYHNHWCRTMGSVAASGNDYDTYYSLEAVLNAGAKRQCGNCKQLD